MRKINILFIVFFLLVISLPLVFIDTKSKIAEKENRMLASFPNFLVFNNGKIDIKNIKDIPKSLDAYINDRFGFRSAYISLANTIISTSNNINGNVVIGKNGWLFYSSENDGKNIHDFFKLNLFSDAEISEFINSINKRIEWCNRNNIKFIFLIAPNKHNIYPELYPFRRPSGIIRTEQVINVMPDSIRGYFVYPKDILLEKKNKKIPLYYETDTHWNSVGAYYAFEILLERIKLLFPETHFPEINFITDVSYDSVGGDIVPMSGFTSYGKTTRPTITPVNGWDSYYQYIKYAERDGIIAKNNESSLPKAIVFRDSFFSALEPFTSTIFSSVEYHWRWFAEIEKNHIIDNKPDIIIWEIVERSIGGVPSMPFNSDSSLN